MEQQPKLVGIEQVSSGWINKYILTYELPDGSLYNYECASRKNLERFRAGLERRGSNGKSTGGHPGEPAEAREAPDAVCIVAKTPRDTLVMIREFRYPLNSWCIAFPAGLVDADEDLATCARRELEEETGYSVVAGTEARPLAQPGFSSTGMTDETVHVVFVEAERAGDAHTERNELIEVFELPIAEIRTFLDGNELPIGTRAQLVLEMVAAGR